MQILRKQTAFSFAVLCIIVFKLFYIVIRYCCEATRLRSRLISVAHVTSLGSLRQKPGSFDKFWMYVYHRILPRFQVIESRLFRCGRTSIEEKIQRQADFHPEIRIARLPNRTPGKLKGWCFFSWHSIKAPFKNQVLIAKYFSRNAAFEVTSIRSQDFRSKGATDMLFAPPWLDAFLSIWSNQRGVTAWLRMSFQNASGWMRTIFKEHLNI